MAISMATVKLLNLIKRFGDANGARTTDEYFNQLIREELISVQVSEVTFARYGEKVKKKPATMAVVTGF